MRMKKYLTNCILKSKNIQILIHAPHVSLSVPKHFYKDLAISKNLFHKYNLEMADIGLLEFVKDYKYKVVNPKYSRLYCDVERFADDEKEIMSKYGEGVVYTHLYDGVLFHKHGHKYKEKVMRYYYRYHNRLDRITKRLLRKTNKLIIIDLHSYSDKMASFFFKPPFPDVCIGIEKDYYDKEIVNSLINKIKQMGLSVEINYPYSGSLVPNYVFNNKIDKKVVSIMIEINKRIYL